MTNDRNFDDLAKRFRRNVYGGLKGDIRQAVIKRDFEEFMPGLLSGAAPRWRVLDAGGGQGQMALPLAQAGHEVTLCDISGEMLQLAQEHFSAAGMKQSINVRQDSIQSLADEVARGKVMPYNLVMCHAVLEWVAAPEALLQSLMQLLQPSGYLSLTFYNVNSLIYKNLLRTNFKKIQQRDFTGYRGSLTPTNPLQPERVYEWLQALPMQSLCYSGIRVFHDYIFNREDREREPATLLELELELSRREPYRSLGRYIHVLGQKSEDSGSECLSVVQGIHKLL